jgi:hypothetical protein
MLGDFTNMALAGLSFLHGENKGSIDRSPTELQLQVQKRVATKAYNLYMHLSRVASMDRSVSFASFVGRGESSKFPTLDPEMVDGLSRAARVDPLPFLDQGVREIVSSAAKMFPHGVDDVGSVAGVLLFGGGGW